MKTLVILSALLLVSCQTARPLRGNATIVSNGTQLCAYDTVALRADCNSSVSANEVAEVLMKDVQSIVTKYQADMAICATKVDPPKKKSKAPAKSDEPKKK